MTTVWGLVSSLVLLVLTLWVFFRMAEVATLPSFHCKRRAKCIKAQEGRFLYVLGHEIFMERVSSLYSHALIGRIEYCRMNKAS